jgi:predicted MFS family arabinose efflux permease
MPPAADLRLRSARRAVATVFLLNGAVLASWVPHVPAVRTAHGLSNAALGGVLLAMAAGAIVAMPVAGRCVGRWGSRAMTTGVALAFAVALPLPILAPGPATLVAGLFVFGALNGSLDVSMNAQAVAVERRWGSPIMSSFHALFSLGGLVGAALAGGALRLGATPAVHVIAASAVATAVVAAVVPRLLPTPPEAAGPRFARPERTVALLGALAFLGLMAEGAMADWSAVWLHDELGASMADAASGFAAFSLAMAAGRFAGDRLVGRFGPAAVLAASGTIAALGLGAALVVARPAVAVGGCVLVGAGIANVIPVLFSRAGNLAGVDPGSGLAAVATMGYLGLLAGPPAIGLAAQATSLPAALGLVAAACAAIALGARVAQDRRPAASAVKNTTCAMLGDIGTTNARPQTDAAPATDTAATTKSGFTSARTRG